MRLNASQMSTSHILVPPKTACDFEVFVQSGQGCQQRVFRKDSAFSVAKAICEGVLGCTNKATQLTEFECDGNRSFNSLYKPKMAYK